jgi:hypothetical protein|tara:strand:- start:2419 stop:2691 length:273 start_codon:yes stop_codon:yes gene_type:complete
MTNNLHSYRTQEQFDEICDSLINGNFYQAVDGYIEYGFNAQDLRIMVDNTRWVHHNKFIDVEDFYQVIESATKKAAMQKILKQVENFMVG